eukprot:m.428926 g.428926  ORF g.428926 m.428926 type:complete len:82 (+) comp16912_c0_seq1:2190-2435(+)
MLNVSTTGADPFFAFFGGIVLRLTHRPHQAWWILKLMRRWVAAIKSDRPSLLSGASGSQGKNSVKHTELEFHLFFRSTNHS